MVFGKKKPTIFDEDQNKQLQALANNQAILIKNNNSFLKDNQIYWKWIQHLQKNNEALLKRIQALEQADVNFKKADAEFDKRLEQVGASLFHAAKAKSEVVEGEAQGT